MPLRTDGTLGHWVRPAPGICPQEWAGPSLSPTLSLFHPPDRSVLGKLSLGEVPRVPTHYPEGGGLGWSES